MAIPQEQFYTIEDINALPNGIRAELIHGEIYYMSPSHYTFQDTIKVNIYEDFEIDFGSLHI